MNELMAVLFLSRDIAHKAHFSTDSYAQHMALNTFYEGVIELADKLGEVHQGRTGEDLDIPYMEDEDAGDIVSELKKYQDWIEANRYTAAPKEDSPIQNIIDEVVSLYLSTRYKLTKLK